MEILVDSDVDYNADANMAVSNFINGSLEFIASAAVTLSSCHTLSNRALIG